MVKEIRVVTVTCGAGASTKVTTTFEKDLVFKRVFAVERSNQNLSNVHVQISINGVPYIRPSIPVSLLGNDYLSGCPLELSVPKGASLELSVTNNLTSEVTIDFAFVVE